MEHHSNIVPWQILAGEKGARLRVIPITDAGELRLDEYDQLLNDRTRIVAVAHVSNALGTINPIAEIVRRAHARGIPVLVDGAQAVAHMPVDVQAIDCDFYAFSGHKVFGPTGIGVLWGRERLLEAMPPYQAGGGTISSVTFERTGFAGLPQKFEAGTPYLAGAIGLATAIDYLTCVGLDQVGAHERDLLVVRDRGAFTGAGSAAYRHRSREGRHPRLRPRRRAPARYRDDPRSRRRGHPRRPPLLSAVDGAARRARDRACLAGALQHARRHRRAGAVAARGAGGVRVSVETPDLYQQVILDHNRHPRNLRVIDGGRRGEGNNPICGDRVTVHLRIEGDVIRDASFQASACAIVKASASLMTESVKARTVADARALADRFRRMITAPPGAPIDDLGPLTALAGVRQFPIRVRCATLPWDALRAAADDRA